MTFFFFFIFLSCGNFFARSHVDALKLFGQEMEVKQKRGVGGSPSASVSPQCDNNPSNRLYGGRSYGVSRRGFRGFVPPIKSNGNNSGNMSSRSAGKCDDSLDDSTKKWLVVQPSYASSSYFWLSIYTNSQIHSLCVVHSKVQMTILIFSLL